MKRREFIALVGWRDGVAVRGAGAAARPDAARRRAPTAARMISRAGPDCRISAGAEGS